MTETVDDIWSDDLLGRKSEAVFIKDFLINRIAERQETKQQRSYVLNLDGSWGQGKSFFLERLHKQLKLDGYMSVYVNAWKDDHADDPMIAVMSAIDVELKSRLSQRSALKKAWDATKTSGTRIAITAGVYGLKKLGSKFIGEGIEQVHNIIEEEAGKIDAHMDVNSEDIKKKTSQSLEKIIDRRAEAALKEFEDTKLSIENFRCNLSAFIDKMDKEKSLNSPLFVMIDELDRCRPTYAISMLERIKHFFDVPGVAFIVTTDGAQLKHSIKAIYGNEFDSNKYLLRFFDRTYRFLVPPNDIFVKYLFASNPINDKIVQTAIIPADDMFSRYANSFNLSLRDIMQCYDILRTLCTTWKYIHPVPLVYIIPLIMLFQQGESENYYHFRRGGLTDAIRARITSIEPLESRHRRGHNQSYYEEKTTMWEVLQYYLKLSQMNFKQIFDEDDNKPWMGDIKSLILKEFSDVHRNMSDKLNMRPTVLNFHSAVESAGQLKIE